MTISINCAASSFQMCVCVLWMYWAWIKGHAVRCSTTEPHLLLLSILLDTRVVPVSGSKRPGQEEDRSGGHTSAGSGFFCLSRRSSRDSFTPGVQTTFGNHFLCNGHFFFFPGVRDDYPHSLVLSPPPPSLSLFPSTHPPSPLKCVTIKYTWHEKETLYQLQKWDQRRKTFQ